MECQSLSVKKALAVCMLVWDRCGLVKFHVKPNLKIFRKIVFTTLSVQIQLSNSWLLNELLNSFMVLRQNQKVFQFSIICFFSTSFLEQMNKVENLGIIFASGYTAGVFCGAVSHPAE